MSDIQTKVVADGVEVRFPYDKQRLHRFKQTFAKASWARAGEFWFVPGVRAEKRVVAWVASEDAREPSAADAQRAKDAWAFDPIKSDFVHADFTGIVISTPYHASIVEIIASLPSPQWQRHPGGKTGDWRIPYTAAAALRAVLPEIERLAREVLAKKDAEKQAREAQWAAERARRAAEREAERAAKEVRVRARFVALLSNPPMIGKPMRLGRSVVVVTDLGKPFRVDEDMPSFEGSHLLGHEGERCCYAYWREATPAEEASLVATEIAAAEAAAARAEAIQEARKLAARAQAQGERPEGTRSLNGKTLIVIDSDQRIFGGGSWWVAADDGLWFVRNNGMDGDNWSQNNISTGGAGAIGWRLPRDPAIEADLERIAAALARRAA